jgi:anthranilate phosphoribosyltransferase
MNLSVDEADASFGKMLDGQMSAEEITALLINMADRGETAEEIAGAAKAMRSRMIRVDAPENAIDVCGTGGDGAHSLNVSTAVALVVAACEVPVAKHGNRAASSKAGAADTLEALGLNLDRAAETAEACLADLGICFLFAQKHHPALGPIMPIRRAIGRRTIFNLLGPLCNPAGVKRQLVGVADPKLIPVYAEALAMLGAEEAMVVAGDEPLDELSISGSSSVCKISNAPFTVHPELVEGRGGAHSRSSTSSDLTEVERITPSIAGLPTRPITALKGGDAQYNAAALQRLLAGEQGGYRDAVLLNAAAALMVAGEARDWKDGVEEAAEAIDKGLAKALLDCWIKF